MLHRLAELDPVIRKAYAEYDYRKVIAELSAFMNTELSAFYFDIRKDTLYCDPASSVARRAALTVIERLCETITRWLAPILVFTAEEAWLCRNPDAAGSIHELGFAEVPAGWRDDALAAKWEKIRDIRRVVTGALEVQRTAKVIGASLEAAPTVYVTDPVLLATLQSVPFAELCITSNLHLTAKAAPETAFQLADIQGVSVVFDMAEGEKCLRCWQILPEVGAQKHGHTCKRCSDALG